jgi:hypothetical protein
MINPIVKVEFAPGAHISDACSSAVSMAQRLAVDVTFEFNGKTLVATEISTAQNLERQYWQKEGWKE